MQSRKNNRGTDNFYHEQENSNFDNRPISNGKGRGRGAGRGKNNGWGGDAGDNSYQGREQKPYGQDYDHAKSKFERREWDAKPSASPISNMGRAKRAN